MTENIYPEFARMLGRQDKERLLGQKGLVVWLFGLSGSGKSTIVNALERQLANEGRLTKILDGDNIRSRLNSNLGFSDEDRQENIRRVAEVARLFLDTGIITLVSFISPTRALRESARQIVGPQDFLEVYVKASFETCAKRDVKGLYAKAKEGKIKQFTGKDSAFEEPESPDLVLDTERHDLQICVAQLRQAIEERVRISEI